MPHSLRDVLAAGLRERQCQRNEPAPIQGFLGDVKWPDGDAGICGICQMTLNEDNKDRPWGGVAFTVTACIGQHVFHKRCLQGWLVRGQGANVTKCPECVQPVFREVRDLLLSPETLPQPAAAAPPARPGRTDLERRIRLAINEQSLTTLMELIRVALDSGLNDVASHTLRLTCVGNWTAGALAIMDAGVAPSERDLSFALDNEMSTVILRIIDHGVEANEDMVAAARRRSLPPYVVTALENSMNARLRAYEATIRAEQEAANRAAQAEREADAERHAAAQPLLGQLRQNVATAEEEVAAANERMRRLGRGTPERRDAQLDLYNARTLLSEARLRLRDEEWRLRHG